MFPVLLLQLRLGLLSLAPLLLPLDAEPVLPVPPLLLGVVPAGDTLQSPQPAHHSSPDGQNLQDSQILLRDLDLVKVNVAPGELAPDEVAVAGGDGGGGLAVVPGPGPGHTPHTDNTNILLQPVNLLVIVQSPDSI